ncbi:TM2 domain-containing protein [Corynebacterium alimapuense]|uniref:TM2 domain-containing protein n=1 Tax=Corynebacterium alimapuense TaxID=1576874 RepID=A0A3M8K729_9CORY|nr:TM2 domain-containing protein [Corynebacterium alimapuense]RNE48298.1 hypothetical protein C5L39_07155 [Corynebacterium alimapuense]
MTYPDPNQFTQYDKDGLPIAPAPTSNPQPIYQAPTSQPMYQAQTPQPIYQASTPQAMYAHGIVDQKSWVVAALLAFFFGTLGVHNFYLGYTSKGAIQLALTVIGWITAILLIGFVFLAVVGIWAFIDFIFILLRSGSLGRDSRGIPLK